MTKTQKTKARPTKIDYSKKYIPAGGIPPLEKFTDKVVPIERAKWPRSLQMIDLAAARLFPFLYPEIVDAIPTDRSAARAIGLRYYRGAACKHGHEHGVRLVSNGACCECNAIKEADPGERAKKGASNAKKHAETKRLRKLAHEQSAKLYGRKNAIGRAEAERDPKLKVLVCDTREASAEKGFVCYWKVTKSGERVLAAFDGTTRDSVSKDSKRRRRADPEKAREQVKRSKAKWKAEKPDEYRAYRANSRNRRRARKAGNAVQDFDSKALLELRRSQDDVCPLTEMPFDFLPTGKSVPAVLRVPHLEHVEALANGGGHVLTNLRYTSPHANHKKGSKPFEHVETVEDEDGEVHLLWTVFADTAQELALTVKHNRERAAAGLTPLDHTVEDYTGKRSKQRKHRKTSRTKRSSK